MQKRERPPHGQGTRRAGWRAGGRRRGGSPAGAAAWEPRQPPDRQPPADDTRRAPAVPPRDADPRGATPSAAPRGAATPPGEPHRSAPPLGDTRRASAVPPAGDARRTTSSASPPGFDGRTSAVPRSGSETRRTAAVPPSGESAVPASGPDARWTPGGGNPVPPRAGDPRTADPGTADTRWTPTDPRQAAENIRRASANPGRPNPGQQAPDASSQPTQGQSGQGPIAQGPTAHGPANQSQSSPGRTTQSRAAQSEPSPGGNPQGHNTQGYSAHDHNQPPHGGAQPGDRTAPGNGDRPEDDDGPTLPRKITVTRVAAWRARQGVHLFRKATRADGAGESGLTSLTYAVMFNYGSDAVMAVALANTLFFSAATAESKSKVFLYLLITVAPFAVVAPVIGPLLDRIRHGRRLALAVSCVGQGALAVVMALNFDNWLLYPAALGMMVLSKSFTVLKAAVTPRVLPPTITLVKTNARLTVFGLIATAVFGGIGAGVAHLTSSSGALYFTAAICVADAVLCMRIPSWVEDTKGEVPASLNATRPINSNRKRQRQPMGRNVVIALWANGTVRLLTGFLTLFAAFVIKAETEHDPLRQVVLLGVIGAAAGGGSFIGNMVGARMSFKRTDQMVLSCLGATLASTVAAAALAGVATAAIVGLVGSVASALLKIALDAVIQSDLPERSRASAFGFSETILQLSWVFGGALGVLLPARFWIGFTVVSCLLAVGITQVLLTRAGKSLIPGIGGNRPVRPTAVDDSPLPVRTSRPRTPTRALPTRRL